MEREQKRIYNREYKDAHRERINAQRRERYAKNPQREIDKVARWCAANPDKVYESRKQYREQNREKLRGYMRERYKHKKEEIAAYSKAWKLRNRDRYRDKYLREEYGIGLSEYALILESQGGVCAICGGIDKIPLAVDHCHTNRNIRGLLCSSCNNGLGRFNDSPIFLRRAAEYIEKAVDSLVQPQ